MKIDFENIKTNTGLDFDKDIRWLFHYLKTDLDYLVSHNKNYTNEQFHRIDTCREILKQISFEEDLTYEWED